MKKTTLGIIILILVVISVIGYFIYQNNNQTESMTGTGKTGYDNQAEPLIDDIDDNRTGYDNEGNSPICTAEAKSCEDGTFVGRTGPNCEFAPCPGKKPKPDFVPTKANQIELPDNVMTVKECAAAGGEVFNTLEKTSYKGEFIGKIEELFCPCACLIRSPEPNILWVNKNGNLKKFTGNLDDIKTYNDCKNAGFKITDGTPAICTVGKPHMTGGKYKVFYNNPMNAGKTCTDYTHSNCPGSCVAKCMPSSCGKLLEGGTRPCTSDCDGAGSCISR